jgi:hypothetical protein
MEKTLTQDSNFKVWNDKIEVTGDTILAMIAASGKNGKENRAVATLEKHGIVDPQKGKWYPLKDYLNALKEMYDKLGPHTMYMIGLQIPNNSIFPPAIQTFEDALELLNDAYHANNRGDDRGYFKYEKQGKNKATMECKRTYGTMIDKGVIVGLSRKFKIKNSAGLVITVDEDKPTREKGDDSTTFILRW